VQWVRPFCSLADATPRIRGLYKKFLYTVLLQLHLPPPVQSTAATPAFTCPHPAPVAAPVKTCAAHIQLADLLHAHRITTPTPSGLARPLVQHPTL
jgi:hypothetical protein